jgi:CBS domain-containing protein
MTRDPVTVSPDLSIADLVRDFFYQHKFVSFPVVGTMGEFLGIVSLNHVRDIPQSEWSARTVGEVMATPPQIKTLSPDDDAMTALGYIIADELGRVPVLSSDGRVVGIITRRDIMTLLTIKTDLGF